MRGSITYQVHQIFSHSGVNRIGFSKHADKEEVRNEFTARDEYARWHDIGQNTGIYSYSTADDYRDIWAQILAHAKDEFSIKDIEKITPDVVRSYLQSNVDHGVKYATFQKYAAGSEKLAVALTLYSARQGRAEKFDFHKALEEVRKTAREELERFDGSRAYERPHDLVSSATSPVFQLAGKVQAESGARIHEISEIKQSALLGVGFDRFTRQELGFFTMNGKGGKDGIKGISVATYNELKGHIDAHGGVFKIREDSYRDSLKAAAVKSGQEYQGSHGLRWNWAQQRYSELQDRGYSDIQAMFEVSKEMGHERADITCHYLGGKG